MDLIYDIKHKIIEREEFIYRISKYKKSFRKKYSNWSLILEYWRPLAFSFKLVLLIIYLLLTVLMLTVLGVFWTFLIQLIFYVFVFHSLWLFDLYKIIELKVKYSDEAIIKDYTKRVHDEYIIENHYKLYPKIVGHQLIFNIQQEIMIEKPVEYLEEKTKTKLITDNLEN